MDEFFDDPAGTIETYVVPEVAAQPLMFNDAGIKLLNYLIKPDNHLKCHLNLMQVLL